MQPRVRRGEAIRPRLPPCCDNPQVPPQSDTGLAKTLAPGKKWYVRLGKAAATEVIVAALDNPFALYKLAKRLVTGEHCPRLQERRPQLFANIYAGGQSDFVNLLDFIWTPEDIPLEFTIVSVTPEGLYIDLREHHVTVPRRTAPSSVANIARTGGAAVTFRGEVFNRIFDIRV